MPIHKVQGGYKWGQSGKTYPTKAQAEKQARAIYAAGYRQEVKDPPKEAKDPLLPLEEMHDE